MVEEEKIRIQQSFPLGGQNGAMMIFETLCPQGCSAKELNELVDKTEAVAARQMMKGQVSAKKAQMEQAILQDRNMTRDIGLIEQHYTKKQEGEIARGRHNPIPMNAKEMQDKRTVEHSMEVNKDTIKRLNEEITELMRIIDGEEKLAAE